jgi:ribosomal protein L37AE/L43A
MKIYEQVKGKICANTRCPEYGKQDIESLKVGALACGECGHPFGWVCDNCGQLTQIKSMSVRTVVTKESYRLTSCYEGMVIS